MNRYAPIAIFAYSRPDHLEQAIHSLLLNTQSAASDLTVFCDGPKHIHNQDGVEKVRKLARSIKGFRSLNVIERDANFGLAHSIIDGVTSIVKESGSVIVIEDDLIVSPVFLEYMNEGLRRYRDHSSVASIHGYCYPVQKPSNTPFFLRGADCWGWATWDRSWEIFNPDGLFLLRKLLLSGDEKELFDFGTASKFTSMLMDQISGKNDSWAVRWYASAFLARKYTLYPAQSYVANIGLDGSGTHCGETEKFDVQLGLSLPESWPELIQEDPQMRLEFSEYLKLDSNEKFKFLKRLRIKIKTALNSFRPNNA